MESVLHDIGRRRIADAITKAHRGHASGKGWGVPRGGMRDLYGVGYRYRSLPHVLALEHAGWYVAGLRSEFRSDTVGAEPPGFPRTCTRWSRATIRLVRGDAAYQPGEGKIHQKACLVALVGVTLCRKHGARGLLIIQRNR